MINDGNIGWFYGKDMLKVEDIPDDSVGFVYKITHTPTDRIYIGKKFLKSKRKVKIGKRELAKIKLERSELKKGGRLPMSKIVIKDSDWIEYFSSNDDIKEMVADGRGDEFKREVLIFCNSKKSLSYYEVKYQFEYNVLENDTSFNSNIMGKFFKRDIQNG